jgi:hypothetical protein
MAPLGGLDQEVLDELGPPLLARSTEHSGKNRATEPQLLGRPLEHMSALTYTIPSEKLSLSHSRLMPSVGAG